MSIIPLVGSIIVCYRTVPERHHNSLFRLGLAVGRSRLELQSRRDCDSADLADAAPAASQSHGY